MLIAGAPRSTAGPAFFAPGPVAVPRPASSRFRAQPGFENGSRCAFRSVKLPLMRMNPARPMLRPRQRRILSLLVMAFLSRDMFGMLKGLNYLAAGDAPGLARGPGFPGLPAGAAGLFIASGSA